MIGVQSVLNLRIPKASFSTGNRPKIVEARNGCSMGTCAN